MSNTLKDNLNVIDIDPETGESMVISPLQLEQELTGKVQRLAFGIICGAVLFFALISSAFAADIKTHSIVDSSTITLGDVFYGLERNEDRVLGSAPRPGQEMVLNARTLLRVAKAMDVDWYPASATDQVTITRAATLIDENRITEKLKDSIRNEGMQGRFGLVYSGGRDTEIILPQDQPDTFAITNLQYNPGRDWFNAEIVAPSINNPIQRIKVSGTIERAVDVPVLKTATQSGSRIRATDIEMIEMAERLVKDDIILNPRDLVGMSPTRIVMAGKPIKRVEIQAPLVVQRGEIVTMHFNEGPLRLTAQAKALENGAKGEVIRVVNTSSSRTLEARIIGEREVTVATF